MEKLFEDAKKFANITNFYEANIEQLIKYGDYIKEHRDEYDCSGETI